MSNPKIKQIEVDGVLYDLDVEINIKPGTDTFEGYPAEFAVVQKDGDNTGEDDGKSNYTNATHAAVFGNNNRIIATKGDDHNARNGFIGGGLQNFIYAENSSIGAGHNNRVGNQEVNYDDSAIAGGNGNAIDADDSFIGGGSGNAIDLGAKDKGYSGIIAGEDNTVRKERSVIAGGQGNVLDAIDSFIGGSKDNELKGTAVYGFGYRCYLNASAGFVVGIDNILGKTKKLNRVFAIGEGLQSETNYQILLGKWNAYDTGAMLIFGGGTSNTNRKNVYTLRASGTPSERTDLVPKEYVDKLAERVAALEEGGGSGGWNKYHTKFEIRGNTPIIQMPVPSDVDTILFFVRYVEVDAEAIMTTQPYLLTRYVEGFNASFTEPLPLAGDLQNELEGVTLEADFVDADGGTMIDNSANDGDWDAHTFTRNNLLLALTGNGENALYVEDTGYVDVYYQTL